MVEHSTNPPPSVRIQRSRANSASSVRARAPSSGEKGKRPESFGRPPIRGSVSQPDMGPVNSPLLASMDDTLGDDEVGGKPARSLRARLMPWSKMAQPDEEYNMTSQTPRSEVYVPLSKDAPRGILYPPAAPSAEPMAASESQQSSASAPATAAQPKPHLTIAEPVSVRAPALGDDEDTSGDVSGTRPRLGSLASVMNAAAASMNPLPMMSSMWSSTKNDDTRSMHTASDGGDAEHDGARRRDETNTGRRRSATAPSTWWRSGDRSDGEASDAGDGGQPAQQLHSDQMVDYLDVIDPAVGVFNTLQNFGNSTMLPNIPWFYNRRPTLHINRVVGNETQPPSPTSPSPTSPTPLSPTYMGLGDIRPPWEREELVEEQQLEREAERLGRAELAHEDRDAATPLPPLAARRHSRPLPRPPVVVAEPTTTLPTGTSQLAPEAGWSSPEDSLRRPSTSQSRIPPSYPDIGTLPMHVASSDGSSPMQKPLVGDDSLNTLPDLDGAVHTDKWWEMDEEERKELDNHIRHLLTNKSKAKRVLRGFWNFVRTPMGFILTTYGLLITAWGMFIVLLAIPWVHVGDAHRQRYWIEICDQVLCALFAAVGLGFAPFRAVDTYRMGYIAHYHFLTYKRRRLLNLPELKNKNELPRYSKGRVERLLKSKDGTEAAPEESGENPKELTDPAMSLEAIGVKHARGGHAEEVYAVEKLFGPFPGQPGARHKNPDELQKQRLKRVPSIDSMIDKESQEVSVLSPTEQATLQHQQRLFHASHTFYRYRETATHWPFPLRLMMAIVILLDCHSILQGTLGGVTWGIEYKHRPTALTATIISFSLSCNAMAGILIWQGGKRTRKTEVVERRLKLALEERAIERMERKKRKAAKLAGVQQGKQAMTFPSRHSSV
ncbi:hypothetical protein CBS9595_001713 [Malassezia furfur]|nr:hypothetical protein CBS9595_001713 [Malassezia furfur]